MSQVASHPVWVVAPEPFRSRWVGWLRSAGLEGVAGWAPSGETRAAIVDALDVRMMVIGGLDADAAREMVLAVRAHFPTVALVVMGTSRDPSLEGVIWQSLEVVDADFLEAVQASVDWVEAKWGADPSEALDPPDPATKVPEIHELLNAQTVRSSPPSECQFHVEVGSQVGGYEVKEWLGSMAWGDAWVAIQPGVNRKVRLILHRRDSSISEDVFVSYFKEASRRRHPNLLTVYAVGTSAAGRFAVDELWQECSLEQRITSGTTADARVVALLADQVISALLDMGSSPVVPVEARHFLFSETGILKVEHLEPSPDGSTLPPEVQLCRVAKLLRGLLRSDDVSGAQLGALLDRLITGEPLPEPLLRTSMARIVVDLAPEKEIELSEEQRSALETIRKSQQNQRWAIAMLIGAVALLLGASILALVRTLSRKDYTDFQVMQRIPEGGVVDVAGQPQTVPAFYLDEFEVTIYQYACFLRDLKVSGKLQEFEGHLPSDWGKIKEAVSTGKPYQFGQVITLNSPIFNVDHFDAETYAAWKGKRLPTAREWMRAARGDSRDKYVRGDAEPSSIGANVGNDFVGDDPMRGGESDGYSGWNPVDCTPRDVSRYGIQNLTGNVSEWLADEGPISMGDTTRLVAGGNFMEPGKALPQFPSPQYPQSRQLWLGFRCAADKLPQQDEKR